MYNLEKGYPYKRQIFFLTQLLYIFKWQSKAVTLVVPFLLLFCTIFIQPQNKFAVVLCYSAFYFSRTKNLFNPFFKSTIFFLDVYKYIIYTNSDNKFQNLWPNSEGSINYNLSYWTKTILVYRQTDDRATTK